MNIFFQLRCISIVAVVAPIILLAATLNAYGQNKVYWYTRIYPPNPYYAEVIIDTRYVNVRNPGIDFAIELSFFNRRGAFLGKVSKESEFLPGKIYRIFVQHSYRGAFSVTGTAKQSATVLFNLGSSIHGIINSKLVVSEDGSVRPRKGYRWLVPGDPLDLRVVIMPNLLDEGDSLRPRPGYCWINPADPDDVRVTPCSNQD